MIECCTVVMSTAIAMDVPPVSNNSFSYLQAKWRPPKAGVFPIDTQCQPITAAHREYGSIRRATIRQSRFGRRRRPEGSALGVRPEGSALGVRPEGSALGVRPEGSALGVRPEGSALGVRPEGSALGVRPEGSALGVRPEGSALGVRPEGSALGVRPEGSALGVRPEGSALGVRPEGVTSEARNLPRTGRRPILSGAPIF